MRITAGGRERIYLDHNATTPIDPAVRAAMAPYLDDLFGNPSSVETEEGLIAGRAVERAREQVATAIGAAPNEIIFTGSCTEANNMAILGAARAQPEKRHLVTTRIEHPAVLGPMRALEREGWEVSFVDVDAEGLVSPDRVASVIREDTVLVSVMGANNEVGAIQPLAAIGQLCADRGVLFHSDLAQLVAYGDIDVRRDHIHLASLSAHKAYGPKGVGALYVRSRGPRARIAPLMFGGGQERGLRPGTVATALVVGMGEALELAKRLRRSEAVRLRVLCERFRERLLAQIKGAAFNGPIGARLPHSMSFSIQQLEPYALVHQLMDRLSISSSSACSSGKVETSHVLIAMFGETARAREAFRIAPGRFTTEADMDEALDAITAAAASLRAIGAAA